MILMYHHLAENAGFNTVSRAHFQEQMDWLSHNKYEVVTIDVYVQGLKSGQLPRNRVTITFDDAYISYKEIALPILRSHGFPSTVFVPTNFVGKSNVWDDGAIPIMDWQALKEIAKSKDVTIGSHGMAHRHMRDLESKVLAEKVRESKAILERELKVAVNHFSYPFGQLRDFDGRCKREIEAAGYDSACSTIWSRQNSFRTLFALHRLEIEPKDDLAQFSAKISRTFHPKYFRQRAKNLLFRLHLRH
jgi:peptidoglycan/xylan/chitin deacetylase (PgdA/CDA1 family)